MSANLLEHQAMWFCSFPFGFAHSSAKSSRVLISVPRFYIMQLISASVSGIASLRGCFAVCAFSSRCWNTSFQAVDCEIWKVATWRFNCRYPCLWPIFAHAGSSKAACMTLPSWWIWSRMCFRRCIITKWKYNLLIRCCAWADSICILSSSTKQRFAAAERLFQAGSLSRSSCLSKLSCSFNASETIFVDLLVQNQLKTSFWQWNSSRYFIMYSIVASVWYP